MKNKGKRVIKKVGGKDCVFYFCNKCGVYILEKKWIEDQHLGCKSYIENRRSIIRRANYVKASNVSFQKEF